jgi:hypothetical protein
MVTGLTQYQVDLHAIGRIEVSQVRAHSTSQSELRQLILRQIKVAINDIFD